VRVIFFCSHLQFFFQRAKKVIVSAWAAFATRFLRLFKRPKLLGDSLQERPKILEADRLSQMVVKSGLDAAPDIFLRSESTECDSFQGLTLFGLTYEFVTTTIRKADVANECVESWP